MDENNRVQELIQHLGSKNDNERWWAADALTKIGKPAVPVLIDALKDKNNDVRFNAALTLGNIGDSSALPALIDALKDDMCVLTGAVYALGKFFENCKTIEDLQAFEEKLTEVIAKLRGKCRTKGEKKRVDLQIAELKRKAADTRDEIAEKKDLLLDDLPKPPKKGKVFQQIRKARIR